MRLNYDDWQKEFLKQKGDRILCTGRQVGKSTICGDDAGEWAIKNRNKNVLMIAPTERQAYGLFQKTLDYLTEFYPDKIKKGKDRPTKTKLKLRNGTTIYCLPTGLNGLGIRFMTVHKLYADEAARIPEDVWVAVTPMLLTTGGDMTLISTAAGKQGYFYECWINKDEAFNSFTRFSVQSEEVMRNRKICETWTKQQRKKALQFIEREKKRMTALQFAQEYMGEFVDDLLQFFPTDLIKECMVIEPSKAREKLDKGLWKHTAGVDVARMGGDETVIATFGVHKKKKKLRQVDMDISKMTRLTETVKRIVIAKEKYDLKKIYIDDGGVGSGVVDILQDMKGYKKKVKAINNASRGLAGFDTKTKKILKEDLYMNLRKLMEQGKIKLFMDDDLYHSMRSVQMEYNNGKCKIFGNYTHITEAIIRAAWYLKENNLNIWIAS